MKITMDEAPMMKRQMSDAKKLMIPKSGFTRETMAFRHSMTAFIDVGCGGSGYSVSMNNAESAFMDFRESRLQLQS